MRINQFSEGIELGDDNADKPAWFIVREDGKIASGPYNSEREARSDTARLQWFTPSQYFIDYGIEDNDNMFVDIETGQIGEDVDQIPKPGDAIRTTKLEGKVTKVEDGYVYFTTPDGRNMRNTIENCLVVEKLADQEDEIFEDEEIDEVSTELLAKYKTAAGKSASGADKKGDFATGNKRFSGIVKATKKQFANDAKKKTEEGTMGGINRSAPSNDVSYEHVLDEVKAMWEKSQLNELSIEKLKAYKDAATSMNVANHAPLRKVAKHMQGAGIANQKIKTKTGDRVGMHQPGRGAYESRLAEFVELDEVDMNQFADILAKQHQEVKAAAPKGKISSIPFHGWEIRYRNPTTPNEKVNWKIFDKKGEEKHSGVALSARDAVSDAEDWIKAGGGTSQKAVDKVTIDFNVNFAREFAPGGETFYAMFGDSNGAPGIYVSFEPQKGFKTSSIRTQKDKATGTTTLLPAISLSPGEANKVGLKPNARYILGDKNTQDANIDFFPLIYQSTSQSKTDAVRLGKPGLTVATSRDTDE